MRRSLAVLSLRRPRSPQPRAAASADDRSRAARSSRRRRRRRSSAGWSGTRTTGPALVFGVASLHGDTGTAGRRDLGREQVERELADRRPGSRKPDVRCDAVSERRSRRARAPQPKDGELPAIRSATELPARPPVELEAGKHVDGHDLGAGSPGGRALASCRLRDADGVWDKPPDGACPTS